MDATAFRREFPVLERLAYLNAGTDGPVPARGFEAAVERLRLELEGGRSGAAYFEGLRDLGTRLRERMAGFLGCDPAQVALTRSTSDGMSTALSSLQGVGRGDEVLTSDEEHPGLLGPLDLARRRFGFDVRVVPFAELAGEVGPRTKLVVTSHVSWVGGRLVDAAAIRAAGARLILDGAQGLGAVPVDVQALDCDFYAASGQKWLCGPDGSGCLYVRAEICAALTPPWPSYASFADAKELVAHEGARRFDMGVAPGPATSWALAAADLLAQAELGAVAERAATEAERLAEALRERGREVAPRDRTTLVSWRSAAPEDDVARLAESGVIVRSLPGRGLVRASVGAWTSAEDVERLLAAV